MLHDLVDLEVNRQGLGSDRPEIDGRSKSVFVD